MEGNCRFNGRRYFLTNIGFNDLEPSYENCIKHKRQNEVEERQLTAGNQSENALPSSSKLEIVLSDTASEEDDTASEEDEDFMAKEVTIHPVNKISLGLGGLNRAQMERERL